MVSDIVPQQRSIAAPRRRAPRGRVLLPLALTALVLGAVLTATSLGPSDTGPADTLVILLEPARPVLEALGLDQPAPSAATVSLVWSIRLPRVLLALIVGGGLGAAGLVMQAVFRNPLADPGVTGVSSGAAVVAVILMVTGLATPVTLPLGAFLGALGRCSWSSSSLVCAVGEGAPCCWSASR